MEILLLLITLGLAIAFAVLSDKLSTLRAQCEEMREFALDRLRQLDRRIEMLERANAERRVRAAGTPAAPITPEPEVPQAPAAPASPETNATGAAEPEMAWLEDWVARNAAPPPTVTAPEPVAEAVATPVLAQAIAPQSPAAFEPELRAAASRATPPPGTQPESATTVSFEEELGGNWLAKLGISILVIGVAFFLAPRLLHLGPLGKSLTALGVSLTLLLGGVWLERKPPYRVFARAGISGGWALLFFTTFAMHHFAATRIIDSLVVDLLLMLLVAAGMVLHSLRYQSQTVTGLAFLLAFATLATSHFEAASGTVIFSLVASAVLALGLVIVTTTRHWARLELAGLIAVLANHFLWLSLVLPVLGGRAGFPLFWQSTALILFDWALFRAAYLLRVPLNAEEDRISSLSAVVLSGGVLGLLKLQSAHPEWAFRALLAMGTIEMLLGVWIGFWARNRRRPAFAVLTTIGTVLLVAAVPFQFHGVSWPVLWLVEAHILALCGLRLGEPIFRRLGLLAGFGASLVLLAKLLVLAAFRLDHPDPSRHDSLTVGLALAAALFWIHGEVYPRRFRLFAEGDGSAWNDFERIALAVSSWLGLGAAAAALWVVLPAPWIAAGWLALVIALGIAADWKSVVSIALQADLLAVLAIPGIFFWDFAFAPQSLYELPEAIAIGLLYAGTRRRTVRQNSPRYVAPAYSWAASLLALFWIGEAAADKWVSLAWLGFAVSLFALGRPFQKGFLRWQAYLAAAFAFCALFAEASWNEPPMHGWFHLPGSELLTLLGAVAFAYGLQEWLRRGALAERIGRKERWMGVLAGTMGTLTLAARLPSLAATWGKSESSTTVWAVLAVALLAAALLLQRPFFQWHALALCLWIGFCWTLGLTFSPSEDGLWWQGILFRGSLNSAILLLGLPFAFPLRTACAADPAWSSRPALLRSPEQWFFFVPFGLMIVTLAAGLRPGNLTLGWSLLGLGAFVFALPLGERSFRLAGLGLLLLCVAKVLLMDVWTFNSTDRYITLIVTGLALVLVSFLYTRLRAFLKQYL